MFTLSKISDTKFELTNNINTDAVIVEVDEQGFTNLPLEF